MYRDIYIDHIYMMIYILDDLYIWRAVGREEQMERGEREHSKTTTHGMLMVSASGIVL